MRHILRSLYLQTGFYIIAKTFREKLYLHTSMLYYNYILLINI